MDHVTFQQKLREFECRIRKWRQLRFGLSDSRVPPRRSTSQDPRKVNGCPSATSSPSRVQLQAIPVGCRTSPMNRKLMNLDFSTAAAAHNDPDRDEIEKRYAAVQANSGKISIMGKYYDVQWEEMKLIGDIGHGSCGQVCKYKYKDYVMAVKQMPRSTVYEENKRIIMDLSVVTKTGDCPNIVRCHGYFICQTSVRICMEMMATCLDRLLKKMKAPFPEDIVGKISVDVVTALDYLKQKHNVIHRDVKPSNILIDWDGNVKMCDFGISGFLVESMAHSVQAGCPPYMAPERLSPDSDKYNYDIRSDVWSLGISIVELATGAFPYPANTEFEILAAILDSPAPSLKQSDGFTENLCSFVELCLRKNFKERARYNALLAHPFITYHRNATTDVGEWVSGVLGCDDDMEE